MAFQRGFPALQHDQQGSPQAFNGSIDNASEGQSLNPAMAAVAAELDRLTHEYEAEAARYAEQAELCGLPRDMLSSKARLNLQLIALMASTLQLRSARPELILAAWASLVVKESKVSLLRDKLKLDIRELLKQLRKAEAQHKILQQAVQDVETQQKAWASMVQDQKQLAVMHRQKTQQYDNDLTKLDRQLDKDHFRDEITHAKLAEKFEEVARLQKVLAQRRAKVASYHDLPASLPGAQQMLRDAQRQLIESKHDMQSRIAGSVE